MNHPLHHFVRTELGVSRQALLRAVLSVQLAASIIIIRLGIIRPA